MAARHGRGAPAGTRTLTAVLALALVGAAVAWRFQGGAPPAAAAASAGVEPPALAPPADEPALEPGASAAELTRRIEQAIARAVVAAERESGGKARASDIEVAVCARELGTGRELVALAADRALRPASNLKLVTSAAALTLFGAAGCFETRIEAGGPLDAGVLRGDLCVRAGGDPFWAAAGDGRAEELLDPLVRALVEAGLAEVQGDLVLDRGTFPAPAPAPGWPASDQHWTDYCALAAGLTLNGGVLTATVLAASSGPAPVEVHPAPHGLAERYGVTASAKSPLDVRVGATKSTVTVRGVLPTAPEAWSASFAHPDPEQLFGSVLRARLASAGIAVRGATRVAAGTPAGRELARLCTPYSSVLAPMNAHSVNSVSDQLFLALGLAVTGSATRAGGRSATERALERLGVDHSGLVQVDGSGLSRDNRVTARQVAALIDGVLSGERTIARLWLDSLAVAGETGTLADRLQEPGVRGRVHAKTGWIAGVSALSGLARPLGRRERAFSILVSYPPEIGGLNTSCFKPLQDEIVAVLLEVAP